MEVNANFSMEFNVKFKIKLNPKLAVKRAFQFIHSFLRIGDMREFLKNGDATQLICHAVKLLKPLIKLIIENINAC